MPMPPSCASAIARRASVTVSIAAETSGRLRRMLREREVARSARNGAPGTVAPAGARAPRTAASASASAPRSGDPELEAKRKKAEEETAAKNKAEQERIAQMKLDNCSRARAQMTTLKSGIRL